MATWKNRPNREPDIRIPFHANYGRNKYVWYLDGFNEIPDILFCKSVQYRNSEVHEMFKRGAWVKILTFKDYLNQAELL